MKSSDKNERSKKAGFLVCDAKSCVRFNNGEWEERFEDLVYGAGP